MGNGIAQVFAMGGYDVTVVEIIEYTRYGWFACPGSLNSA